MFVACAVADESQWASVSEGFDAIRRDNAHHASQAERPELHGHELMGGSGDWKPLRGKHWVSAAIYARALETMRDSGVRVVVRGIDITRLNARYRYPDPPYSLALQFSLERLNEHLVKRCASSAARVVADEVHTQAQHVRQFGDFKADGTPWYRTSKLECVDHLEYGDSRSHDGLQAADLAVYLYRRRYGAVYEGEREHPQAKKTRKALWRILHPMLLPESDVWQP